VIDARSDIYALGAVTYEMLTGEPPFTGPTVQAIVARVLNEEPRPIHQARKTVPEHVEVAVLKALAKLPADRFGSAAAFAAAVSATGSATAARALPRSRRPRQAVIWLGAFGAVVAAFLVGRSMRGIDLVVGTSLGGLVHEALVDWLEVVLDGQLRIALLEDACAILQELVDLIRRQHRWCRSGRRPHRAARQCQHCYGSHRNQSG
jgi:serine/threonine-protein kinase